MKKKYLIIILFFISVFIVGIIAKYYDSARVRTGHEPKLVLKIVSKDGEKITYWGLGYKVVRYPSVSPSEPYKNNRGVKMGNWFMSYNKNDNDYQIKEIIDTTKEIKNFSCAEALEEFYSDDEYTYYFDCIKSSYVLVRYTNGIQLSISKSLKYGYITIKDLDKYQIDYIKYAKK